ncbi:hypothetical protein E5675_19010 [Sphingopyxis sp. PAMC25046]|uniref:hypothetical protein n=1 Tax=Sphingopyxis sp. PAMC25046 TaxID=2565556 RepID=UPI00109DE1D4|nr:hypothetical protein [Sphingopyxis sp. PAMC25046]QCB56313.1 hypothetical protein E5675_19010 [Sphingopyxis sp. PAMC25046]
MTPDTDIPARVGRERTCAQCASVYRSQRASSRYCSNACRLKAGRGKAPTGGPHTGLAGFSVVSKMLMRRSLAGQIALASSRDPGPAVYALTVPADYAYEEMRALFDRKGFGMLTREEFNGALRADGLRAYSTDAPDTADRKRWQARQRTAAARP